MGDITTARLKETGQPWGNNGNKGGVVHQGYLTDVITDVALDWLDKRRPDRPFCLLIHHKAPHSPHDPAPRHKDLFKDTVFPGAVQPAGRLQGPGTRAGGRRHLLVAPDPEPGTAIQVLQAGVHRRQGPRHPLGLPSITCRNYLRLVAALDENVGRVLDYLDKSGLAKNTIVIYTSDNGYFLGEHGFYNKMWMYEEGFHIPLIVRMPGRKARRGEPRIWSACSTSPLRSWIWPGSRCRRTSRDAP